MYAGQVVEEAPVRDIFATPRHPYTLGLLASIPGSAELTADHRLPTIGGAPPNPLARPEGCRFAPRCPLAVDACRTAEPELAEIAPGRRTRCIRWQEVAR